MEILANKMHTKLGKFSIKLFGVNEQKNGQAQKRLLVERVQTETQKVFKKVNASTSRRTERGLKQGLKCLAKPLRWNEVALVTKRQHMEPMPWRKLVV